MNYLFAAYSVAFIVFFIFVGIQGKRIKRISNDLSQMKEWEQDLHNKHVNKSL